MVIMNSSLLLTPILEFCLLETPPRPPLTPPRFSASTLTGGERLAATAAIVNGFHDNMGLRPPYRVSVPNQEI